MMGDSYNAWTLSAGEMEVCLQAAWAFGVYVLSQTRVLEEQSLT